MRLVDLAGTRSLRRPALFAALALATVAAWPLLSMPGLVNTRGGGDSPFLLLRLYELQANLWAGVVPARWMPDAAYGLGYPFFNYYASLPYYLAAGFSLAGAGVLWAIKLTQLVGFLGAAAGMYALVDDLLDDPLAAFLAAVAYTFAPFHMVNVYVRGDSLSEFYAFVFYPLILWGIVRLRRSPTVGHVALLAAAYGGLTLTHNVSALIFSPLAGLTLLWAVLSAPRYRLRVLLAGLAALLLGAALGAWFAVPALLERNAVSLTDMTTGYFSYAGHFRGRNLVQSGLLFDYRFDSDHTPFVVGGVQAGLTIAALLLIAASWLQQRRFRWADLSLVPLLAYAVWPITPSSAIAWARVPLLPMVQFPWRFLSIVALATAIIAAVGLSRLGRLRWLALALGPLLALSALALLRPEPLPLRETDITAERLQLYEHLTGNLGSTVRAEYLPAQAIPRPFTSAALLSGQPYPSPLASKGVLDEARLLSGGPTQQVWELVVDSPQADLVFQTYAFPGWQATVDGQAAAIDPTVANGRIAVQVDQGRHQVTLRLGRTPLRTAAEQSSLVAGLIILGLALAGLWRSRHHWRRLLLAIAVVGVAGSSAALLGALAPLARPPSPGLSTETMDFVQMPYLHANPHGVAFGESSRLLGYELSTRQADAGDTIEVRLHWQSADSGQLRSVVRLTTAAEALFRAPTLARSEAPLSAVTEHTLTLPPEVAPGLALLAVEVQGPQGALEPHTDSGTRLGTVHLAPVRVRQPPEAPDLPAQGRLGKSLDLLQATADEVRPGILLVRVTWRPTRPLPEDYVTSVRLWDPEGRQVPKAGLDVQPRYGLYPTSLWPVDCPVADYYEFAVPAGTPPGPGYQVELTLYQASTLAPLGSIRIPDVTLTNTTIDPNVAVVQAFEGGLAIARWRVERSTVKDGETVAARVQWTAQRAPLPDLDVRFSLHDAQGRELAASQDPLLSFYPPSRWPLHALVDSRLHLHVPPGTPAGQYQLRLELLTVDGRALGSWSPPDQVRVKAAQRNTSLPAFAHPVGAEFGGLIRLPGYDLERSGEQIAVTFHWQALQAPGHEYKVFLHCFDPADEKIVAQRDAGPLSDTYPTSRWAAGEVVSDRLVLDMKEVAAGRYVLAVGWYDPTTGERLEPSGGSATISNRRVLLQEVDWP